MTGLGDLFDEAEGREASAASDARLAGESLGAVHTRVRRAHARRSALQATFVAIAVVVLGAGVVYGASRSDAPPAADQPSASGAPSVSGSASPSATPSTTPTAAVIPVFAGTVTVDPHLPEASAITPEVWRSAGPGWALVSYREQWFDASGAEAKGPQVIYLVSPSGERYELVNLGDADTVSVLAWEVGSATAAVTVAAPSGDKHLAMVDLATGASTSLEGYAPWLWSLAFLDADGRPVWNGGDAFAWVSIGADGVTAEYVWPEVGNGAEVAYNELAFPGIDCGANAPFDDESEIVTCWDNRFSVGGSEVDPADAQHVVSRVWPESGRVEVLHESTYADGTVRLPTRAGDHVLGAIGAVGLDGCPTSFAVLVGGTATPVPGADGGLHPSPSVFPSFGAVGSSVVWGMTSGCSSDATPMVVIASDLDAGTYSVLVPYPEGRPEGEHPYESVTGVAVGR